MCVVRLMHRKLQLKELITTNSCLLNILSSFFSIYETAKRPIQNTSNTLNEQILSCTSKCHIRPSQSMRREFSFCLINNHFDNILRLFNVLPNFLFTTSERMCDYYFINVAYRSCLTSCPTKVLKQERLKTSLNNSQAPRATSKMKQSNPTECDKT